MHSNDQKILIFGLIPLTIAALSSCGHKNEKRVYQEIVIESPLKAAWQGTGDPHAALHSTTAGVPMLAETEQAFLSSSAHVPLTWKTPEGWQELPGSGFRLVTFKAGENGEAIECSIVSLSGEAGGIEANLLRWMTQINLKAPSDGILDFLKENGTYIPGDSMAGHLPINYIDFTQLQKSAAPATPSMYAGIIEGPDSTIFVKMTGSLKAIKEHTKKFQTLSHSIELK